MTDINNRSMGSARGDGELYNPLRKCDRFSGERMNNGSKQVTVVAIANQKGGCGKTTTAINLAAALSLKGKRTLLIDLDPQAHATLGLGIDIDGLEHTIYDVFASGLNIESTIVPTMLSYMDIVPSAPVLSGVHIELEDFYCKDGILNDSVANIKSQYEYIIIDCSPTLSFITLSALAAARYVLIPIQTQYFALEGMKELFTTIDLVTERLNKDLDVLGILPTMFDEKVVLFWNILSQIRDYFKSKVFDTVINMDHMICEASMFRQPVGIYDAKCRGAMDYNELASEFINRVEMKNDLWMNFLSGNNSKQTA